MKARARSSLTCLCWSDSEGQFSSLLIGPVRIPPVLTLAGVRVLPKPILERRLDDLLAR